MLPAVLLLAPWLTGCQSPEAPMPALPASIVMLAPMSSTPVPVQRPGRPVQWSDKVELDLALLNYRSREMKGPLMGVSLVDPESGEAYSDVDLAYMPVDGLDDFRMLYEVGPGAAHLLCRGSVGADATRQDGGIEVVVAFEVIYNPDHDLPQNRLRFLHPVTLEPMDGPTPFEVVGHTIHRRDGVDRYAYVLEGEYYTWIQIPAEDRVPIHAAPPAQPWADTDGLSSAMWRYVDQALSKKSSLTLFTVSAFEEPITGAVRNLRTPMPLDHPERGLEPVYPLTAHTADYLAYSTDDDNGDTVYVAFRVQFSREPFLTSAGHPAYFRVESHSIAQVESTPRFTYTRAGDFYHRVAAPAPLVRPPPNPE